MNPDFYISQYLNAKQRGYIPTSIPTETQNLPAFDYSLVDGSKFSQPQTSAADFQNMLQGYMNNLVQNGVINPSKSFSQPLPSGVTVTGGK